MLPQFNEDGYLAPGLHLCESVLSEGLKAARSALNLAFRAIYLEAGSEFC
jgi:hypothetical protein